MKKILIASITLALSLLTVSAAVITVSDPGQPTNQTTLSGLVAEYTRVRLTLRDAKFGQTVFLIVERRGQTFVSKVDAQLYLPGKEKDGKATLGDPIPFMGDQAIIPVRVDTNGVDVSIWAKVSHIETYIPNDPSILGLDITGIAVHGYTTPATNVTFEGAFPLTGSTHWIWTNQAPPVAQIEKFRLSDFGDRKEFFLSGTIKPHTRYAVEATTDLINWETVKNLEPGPFPLLWTHTGILETKYNEQKFFRLKESP